MTYLLQYPSARTVVIDYLSAALPDVQVGAAFPTASMPDDKRVVQIALDGTPIVRRPGTAGVTIRTVAWAAQPSDAEALLLRTQAHMLAYPGGSGVTHISALTGSSLTPDPETGLWMCWATFRVQARASASSV